MLEKTRLKLTGWYLLIIMTISVAFSAFIYFGASREFDRILRVQRYRLENPQTRLRIAQPFPWQQDDLLSTREPEPQVIEEAKMRVLIDLLGVNIIILVLSSLAGYFMAGITLKPIQKMVDEQNRFITDASHELRTPLTSLRSEIEVALRNKKISGQDALKILESNLEEVVDLQLLSDNLLELAQDQNGINLHEMEEISLFSLLQEATRKINPQSAKKQIQIKNKVKDMKIEGVKDRLREVFVILLDNAVKYSPENTTVTIESKNENGSLFISVTDNGIGIAKEDLPYIFDRFYRANKSRSKIEASGYGLGLSIAKKIVEMHNGKISAHSIRGKKTVFTIEIPLRVNSD